MTRTVADNSPGGTGGPLPWEGGGVITMTGLLLASSQHII